MAHRYWKLNRDYGFVGTDSYDTVDAADYLGLSEEDLEKLTDDELESKLTEAEWEDAIQQVEVYVERIEEDEME